MKINTTGFAIVSKAFLLTTGQYEVFYSARKREYTVRRVDRYDFMHDEVVRAADVLVRDIDVTGYEITPGSIVVRA